MSEREKVMRLNIQLERGFFYFVDNEGDISRVPKGRPWSHKKKKVNARKSRGVGKIDYSSFYKNVEKQKTTYDMIVDYLKIQPASLKMISFHIQRTEDVTNYYVQRLIDRSVVCRKSINGLFYYGLVQLQKLEKVGNDNYY